MRSHKQFLEEQWHKYCADRRAFYHLHWTAGYSVSAEDLVLQTFVALRGKGKQGKEGLNVGD